MGDGVDDFVVDVGIVGAFFLAAALDIFRNH
jgi:hypothetical protein